MPEPASHLALHTQLTTVITTLEQELAELEQQREKLAAEIDKVLYRHTTIGERRTGQRRGGSDRRASATRRGTPGRRATPSDRRLPEMDRLAALDAKITALLETAEILKKRHNHLLTMTQAEQAADGTNAHP